MSVPLGRNGLVGLAVGATAGLGLIAFLVYRQISRRRSQSLVLETRPATRLFIGEDGGALLGDTLDAQGRLALTSTAQDNHELHGCHGFNLTWQRH